MFGAGYRTPAKGSQGSADLDPQKPKTPGDSEETGVGPLETLVQTDHLTKVRRSIGEWETGKTGSNPNPSSPPVTEDKTAPLRQKARVVTVTAGSLILESTKPRGRVAEAKACLIKAKLQINSSRNLKAEIKAEVVQAVEKLYRLVKEAEEEKPPTTSSTAKELTARKITDKDKDLKIDLARKLEEHSHMLKENTQQMSLLKQQMESMKSCGPATYASVTAASTSQSVYSMVVSSAETEDTSEVVIEKIRTAVNARASGIRVDRLRKAREGKVVLGCRSKDELAKVAEKLKSQSALLIEKKENKDPQIILKNVLNINTDDEILAALQKQNGHILGEIPEEDYRAIVRYRRRARNPHECHVVLRVSPRVWKCLTTAGRVHVDLQRVQVDDQSPLLQCTKCLAFGHGKKSCIEAADLCSHCTGPHMRKDCPHWGAGDAPKCRNCTQAKLDKSEHNAFDTACPIRVKWDRLARSNVAYC